MALIDNLIIVFVFSFLKSHKILILEKSVWPLIYDVTKAATGYEYPLDKIIQVENNVRLLSAHVQSCFSVDPSTGENPSTKENCLMQAIHLLTQNTNDVKWALDADMIDEDRVTMLHFRTGFIAMDMLVARIMEMRARKQSNDKVRKNLAR